MSTPKTDTASDSGAGDAWKGRAAALAAVLAAEGVVPDPAWKRAFASIPRHLFTPHVLIGDSAGFIELPIGVPRWWAEVYSNNALLTQTASTGAGAARQDLPTSSSSQPSVMAVMLDRLNIADADDIGQQRCRVLEIGTGTGYNTALLTHRLGESNVVSVDIDPELVETARGRLASLGLRPALRSGDGASGWPEQGPFDRILATCAITHIPPAWIEQLTPGGRIVAPLDADAGPLLVADKPTDASAAQPSSETENDGDGGELVGRVDAYPAAAFMPLRRSVDDPLGPGQTMGFAGGAPAQYGTTALDPRTVLARDRDYSWFCWLHAPGLRVVGSVDHGSVVVYTADAMAEATVAPGRGGTWNVVQRGARRLWDTIEHATATYDKLGRPARTRFGLTAGADPMAGRPDSRI
uniref:methyltransferase domain-containing protein n=1 Tax=Fodinicola feengrottensis TaxID=435914 RepID=UPI0013D214BE